MKHILTIVLILYIHILKGQETDTPFYLQQPLQFNELELKRALDSLALQQLNTKYFHSSINNLNFSNPDSAIHHITDSIRMSKLFGSYADFKSKFLGLEMPAENPNLQFYRLPKYNSRLDDADFEGQVGFSFTGPVSFIYNAFSKEEQSLRKYNALKRYEPKRKRIDAKYNTQKIQYWTGLNGEKLTKFVLYCHFEDEYLLNVSEYELIDTIFKKLIEFRAKEDSSNYSN